MHLTVSRMMVMNRTGLLGYDIVLYVPPVASDTITVPSI